ncbi:MAG: hypothetical protein IPP79_05415 [Chitinophagaceae bacterium]|nr:hypothetical protein [Chitinophagaceae bacterium]
MNLRRFIGKIRACWNILRSKAYPSFSQAGEDQIVRYLFTSLNISRPTFLDIGTNDPIIGNNTYSLYLRGSRGVCVEPDNRLCDKIKRVRPEDILLRMGVGLEANGEADLYVFPDKYHSWNTFSKNDADKKVYESGIKVLKIDKVPLITINEIVNLYFSET